MVYFFIAVIMMMFFLGFQKERHAMVGHLIGTMLCYTLALLFMIMYLSRDVRYYNIIEKYFLLPKSLWESFMFFKIPKSMIIRLMNLFNLLTIFWGCKFSTKYLNQHDHGGKKFISTFQIVLGIYLCLEYLLYDPAVGTNMYLFLYPRFMSVQQYEQLISVIHSITVVVNIILVLLSMANLIWVMRKIHFFPAIKYYAYGEIFSYILLMISYLLLLGTFPDYIVRYSRVSGYTSYISLELYDSVDFYKILPFFLIFSSVLMCASTFAISQFYRKMNQKEFTISGQIDAVNTSSKAFCHYMKNELLAIESEIQLLDIAPENQKELMHITERCQNLYDRLDKLHRSTRISQLTMEPTDLELLVKDMLERMKPELHGCQIVARKSEQIPTVFVDANIFEQALHNIVTNALDAMKDIPEEKRSMTFTLRTINNWVALSITDTGCGIAAEDVSRVFEPFFTSQPIARHWGIGMTMTYQIVKAHHGRISVESRPGRGTTFRILLPNLKKMFE